MEEMTEDVNSMSWRLDLILKKVSKIHTRLIHNINKYTHISLQVGYLEQENASFFSKSFYSFDPTT